MRWIDALTDCAEKSGAATAIFDVKHFAVARGAILETALAECVAQTAAAILSQNALNDGKSGAVANGMLVAISNFKFFSPPPLRKILRIEVCETKRLGPLHMIKGTVFCDGTTIAAGELMVYA